MQSVANRKTKIILSDYNYRRDIDTRLVMARLSVDAIRTLREILDSSLKTSVAHLADALEISLPELNSQLEQLSDIKLFVRRDEAIIVDKEMRKYLESQMIKFDPDYEMGIDFLQNIFSKIPIQAIPNWYALSRTSDHLFSSLIEKYLETPQLYQRYLDEMEIDFPNALQIGKEVLKSPDFCLNATYVMDKYKISHDEFEECILHLEYNLMCCLSYRQVGDKWEEIVTPFHEWREYLTFLRDTAPTSIANPEEIERDYADDFGFLNLLTEHVKKKISVSEKIVAKMLLLHLLEETPNGLQHSQRTDHWLQLPLHEQAATLYRRMLHHPYVNELFNDRDLRHVQKSLKRVTKAGWIYFEDYLLGLTKAIGTTEPVQLKNRGKRWSYTRPIYTQSEKEFVYHAIFETFLQVGIVATGRHNGKACFSVTPFGRLSLDD